ncbi:MAG: hypothetical protein AB7E13_09420 [Arcobacteraceae bacterium]|jgi:hypothetical protein
MSEPHVISALVNKRSELLGDIQYYEKIIKGIKENLASIDKTIHIFDEDYNLSSIKAKNTNNDRYFKTGEATTAILDVLRISGEALTFAEVTDKVIEKRGMVLNERDVKAVRKSLSVTLNSLLKKGLVSKELMDHKKSLWNIARV